MKNPSEQVQAKAALFFSNFGHALTHMFTVLFATAVLYLPNVFNLPYGELLGLSSLGLILYGVAALPAGWLGDRWSQVGMMAVFFFGIGIGAIIVGLAVEPKSLFIGLTLIGLFASIYHPVGIAWVVAWANKKGLTLGVNGVFGNSGSAIAPVFVGLMIDHLNWRAAFIIPAIFSIFLGISLLSAWKAGWIKDVTKDRSPTIEPDSNSFVRVFIILTLTMACSGFVYSGLTNTMPKLFEMGLSNSIATSYTEIGIFVGIISGLASLSSIFGGWMADRYSARSIYIIFWILQFPLLLAIASLSDMPLLIATLLVLCFLLAFTSAENMLVAQYTPFRWRSVAYGAKFVLALGVGGLTVHLAGWSFDQNGDFGLMFLLFSGAALLAALAAFVLPKTHPRLLNALGVD